MSTCAPPPSACARSARSIPTRETPVTRLPAEEGSQRGAGCRRSAARTCCAAAWKDWGRDAHALAAQFALDERRLEGALFGLESEGFVIRGRFEADAPDSVETQWCERRLLARIHRYTLKRLRSEIEAVAPADFMRFLFHWQGLGERREGIEALAAVLTQLEGYAAPAAAWEAHILPARLRGYSADELDRLCSAGRFAWLRLVARRTAVNDERDTASGAARRAAPLRNTPISFVPRRSLAPWRQLNPAPAETLHALSADAGTLAAAFERHPAAFFEELQDASGLLHTRLETALAELVALAGQRRQLRRPALLARTTAQTSRLCRRAPAPPCGRPACRQRTLDMAASRRTNEHREHHRQRSGRGRTSRAHLLRRYGVVFRTLLAREAARRPGATW